MFTKKRLCLTGKSALLGAALSSMLLATMANAASLTGKHETRPTSLHHSSPSKKHVSRQKKSRQSRSKISKTALMKDRLSAATPGRSQIQEQSPTILPLGSFTLRSYTHPTSKKVSTKTATGTIPSSGRTVAVDPRVIPFGTKIYIEGLGERIAEDSGANIKGRQLDIFLPSVEHCRHFGVQTREVQVMVE